MEFSEKLQTLRKSRQLTQEELAEALYVSRTAISKWESGRGYPNIESLKEISRFFSVSIDELLSGEKLLGLAEKENKANIRRVCNRMLGAVDLFSVMLIVLPLYPLNADSFVFSVNLPSYAAISPMNRWIHWGMYLLLALSGLFRLLLIKEDSHRLRRYLTMVSMGLGACTVLYLGLAREAYATCLAFLLFMVKVMLMEAGKTTAPF